MNFSDRPSAQVLKGETLYQKVMNMDYDNWGYSTNLEAVFDFILSTVVNQKHAGVEVDVPKAVVIISDMEINQCMNTGSSRGRGYSRYNTSEGRMTFYDKMRKRFSNLGVEIPNIIFWNVNSRHDIFHVDKDRVGVQLASGAAASTFKSVMDAIGMTPVEAMIKTLSNERYDAISVAENYKKIELK